MLKNAGVDFYAIETMTSLRHARAAVLACRDFGLPVFVTMVVEMCIRDSNFFTAAIVPPV